ncbi:uncharacterized protein [Epargyreus clarus]|uniref:uncharacterized protein n=1 Tax=Epargyreus clarus TaxID=520877 RepID=UPI003C2F75E9
MLGGPGGCYAHVGYWEQRGVHTLNLARNVPGVGCFRHGTIVHEWLHIVGFLHMLSTYNRNEYVKIVEENLRPAKYENELMQDRIIKSNSDCPRIKQERENRDESALLAPSYLHERAIIPPARTPSPNDQVDQILRRLQTLEEESRAGAEARAVSRLESVHAVAVPGTSAQTEVPPTASPSPYATPQHPTPASLESGRAAAPPPSQHATNSAAERLLEVICSLPVRSNQYFVSDFDPSVHDVDTWCCEVDKACVLNRWDDSECLARVGNCLKGESRTWLSQWTSTTRTWSNFKLELKALCPRNVDIANILYDVMRTESDKFSTYAEYARKSLLRLRIVKGLNDELLTAIIIRGITDPQVRACAMNAKLTPDTVVEYLSNFVKSVSSHTSKKIPPNSNKFSHQNFLKRKYTDFKFKCYECNQYGHKSSFCPKKSKPIADRNNSSKSTLSLPQVEKCAFCKKLGHSEDICFAKERVESRNKNGVNFCQENEGTTKNPDVVTAVILGIPVDVLIDSGSCVSLLSRSLVKHFACHLKTTHQILRGLGGAEIVVDAFTTLPVELNDITLEVDFFVIDKKYLNTPVIIGTDVLNRKGVSYVRTDLLEKEIIRESDSAYASPVLLVKKKDGSDRMVVDYRALNQITVKDRHPLPLINDHIDRVACIAALLRKGVSFHWGDDQEKARQEIIALLTDEPVLAIFDPELRTELHTDASSIGSEDLTDDGNVCGASREEVGREDAVPSGEAVLEK